MLDEAQNIKDAESSRFRAIGNLRSKRRLLLTGEPPSSALLACSRMSEFCCMSRVLALPVLLRSSM